MCILNYFKWQYFLIWVNGKDVLVQFRRRPTDWPGLRKHEIQSWFCHLLAMWLWKKKHSTDVTDLNSGKRITPDPASSFRHIRQYYFFGWNKYSQKWKLLFWGFCENWPHYFIVIPQKFHNGPQTPLNLMKI